jgi:hypothetical protein
MQILAEVEPEVLERLHIDVVPLEPALARWMEQDATEGVEKRLFDGTTVYFAPGTSITEEADGSWILCDRGGEAAARMSGDGFYFDFIRCPMRSWRRFPAALSTFTKTRTRRFWGGARASAWWA